MKIFMLTKTLIELRTLILLLVGVSRYWVHLLHFNLKISVIAEIKIQADVGEKLIAI